MYTKYKVVFHLSDGEPKVLERMLSNIHNLIKITSDGMTDIIVVVNGDAVELFLKTNIEPNKLIIIKKLKLKGVKFYICNNTLKVKKIDVANIINEVSIVDTAIKLIIELQYQGYAYVKP